jgi:hypothetical protein
MSNGLDKRAKLGKEHAGQSASHQQNKINSFAYFLILLTIFQTFSKHIVEKSIFTQF